MVLSTRAVFLYIAAVVFVTLSNDMCIHFLSEKYKVPDRLQQALELRLVLWRSVTNVNQRSRAVKSTW